MHAKSPINNEETKKIKTNIIWEDDNDERGFRPYSIIIELKANDKIIEEVSIGEFNNWTYTFEVPVFYNNQSINYTVDEKEAPMGYTKKIDNYNIINTLFKYSIKGNILCNGGQIIGEENVFPGESQKGKIIIIPDKGYRIKETTINNDKLDLSKQSSFLELPPFESVMEDKIINVCFEKEEEVKKDEKVKKEEQTKQVDIEKEKTENVGIENPETSDEIIIFLLIFVTSSVLIFVLSRRLMTLKKQ